MYLSEVEKGGQTVFSDASVPARLEDMSPLARSLLRWGNPGFTLKRRQQTNIDRQERHHSQPFHLIASRPTAGSARPTPTLQCPHLSHNETREEVAALAANIGLGVAETKVRCLAIARNVGVAALDEIKHHTTSITFHFILDTPTVSWLTPLLWLGDAHVLQPAVDQAQEGLGRSLLLTGACLPVRPSACPPARASAHPPSHDWAAPSPLALLHATHSFVRRLHRVCTVSVSANRRRTKQWTSCRSTEAVPCSRE